MKWSEEAWKNIETIYSRILEMPFIKELTDGSLPLEKFRFYMLQDAHYLNDFGKALALLGARAEDADTALQFMTFGQHAIIAERSLHESYFKEYDIKGLESMAPDCHHYVSYLKGVVALDSWAVGVAAVLPCFWIYEQVGLHILKQADLTNNPYHKWIATYAGDDFAEGVKKAITIADEAAEKSTPAQREKMLAAFKDASRLEWLFWDGSYHLRHWNDER